MENRHWKTNRLTARKRAIFLGVVLLVLAACTPQQTPTPIVIVVTATEAIPQTGETAAIPTNTEAPTETPEEPTATVVQPTATFTTAPTEVAQIQVDSQVRRLTSSVFAGPGQPLSELFNNNPFDLEAGGFVTTNASGEAEVVIQGCLKLFVFQDTQLVRRTCRREDAQSGLGICTTGGFTGVVNDCAALIDIQTPSALVQTSGTWFSVIYLEQDQMTIVQTYDGDVQVNAITDMNSGATRGWQGMSENSIWFSTPGSDDDVPNLGGIDGRGVNDIQVWEAMRSELIDRYPMLDVWMGSGENRADSNNLPFPDFLTLPEGRVVMNTHGELFFDERIANFFTAAIDWNDVINAVWGNSFNVSVLLDLPLEDVENAQLSPYDPERGKELLAEAGYQGQTIYLPANEEDYNSYQFTLFFESYLSDMGVNTQLLSYGGQSFQSLLLEVENSDDPAIWFTFDGEAFENQ